MTSFTQRYESWNDAADVFLSSAGTQEFVKEKASNFTPIVRRIFNEGASSAIEIMQQHDAFKESIVMPYIVENFEIEDADFRQEVAQELTEQIHLLVFALQFGGQEQPEWMREKYFRNLGEIKQKHAEVSGAAVSETDALLDRLGIKKDRNGKGKS